MRSFKYYHFKYGFSGGSMRTLELQSKLARWLPDCQNRETDVMDSECPDCFGGNISTVYTEKGIYLQCNECGAKGAPLKMTREVPMEQHDSKTLLLILVDCIKGGNREKELQIEAILANRNPVANVNEVSDDRQAVNA